MPRYTMCPFYVDENKKSISCEDVCRTYRNLEEKNAWMDMYCDSWEWAKCPYAADRSEAYAAYEKGDGKALDNEKIKALEKENKYLRTLLGKAEKRVERQQKKIDDLRAVNQSFIRVNTQLEKTGKEHYNKWRDANTAMEIYEEKIAYQVQQISDSYEARLAYMMDTYTNGVLHESDVKEWLKGKEFAIVWVKDEDGGEPFYKVMFKESGADGEDNNVQISEEQDEQK